MKMQAVLEENKYTTQIAGVLGEEIIDKLAIEVDNREILIYPGAIKHIKKRHPHAFRCYFRKMPEIIGSPDFIGTSGQNPKRIECVKQYKDSILVALKYNDDNQLFVSSMYIIEESRIEKRVSYGRLVRVERTISSHKANKQRYRNLVKNTRR